LIINTFSKFLARSMSSKKLESGSLQHATHASDQKFVSELIESHLALYRKSN